MDLPQRRGVSVGINVARNRGDALSPLLLDHRCQLRPRKRLGAVVQVGVACGGLLLHLAKAEKLAALLSQSAHAAKTLGEVPLRSQLRGSRKRKTRTRRSSG